MYIEQAFKGKYKLKNYIAGCLIIVFVILILGSFPILFIDVNPDDTLEKITQKIGVIASFVIITTPFVLGFISILFIIKIVHKIKIINFLTKRKSLDFKRFFFSFFIWGGFIIIYTLVDYIIYPDDYEIVFDTHWFFIQLLVSMILITIQASFEELFFRGYLMQFLGILFKNKWFAFLFTSISFGLLHTANPEVDKLGNLLLIHYIVTGLFLGILTLMDGGLELALGFHIANNLVGSLLITSEWSVLQTYSIFMDISEPNVFVDIFTGFIFYPIFICIVYKRYHWSNWKSNLFGRVIYTE